MHSHGLQFQVIRTLLRHAFGVCVALSPWYPFCAIKPLDNALLHVCWSRAVTFGKAHSILLRLEHYTPSKPGKYLWMDSPYIRYQHETDYARKTPIDYSRKATNIGAFVNNTDILIVVLCLCAACTTSRQWRRRFGNRKSYFVVTLSLEIKSSDSWGEQRSKVFEFLAFYNVDSNKTVYLGGNGILQGGSLSGKTNRIEYYRDMKGTRTILPLAYTYQIFTSLLGECAQFPGSAVSV